eukprot:2697253-Amphidinium_carterae.1
MSEPCKDTFHPCKVVLCATTVLSSWFCEQKVILDGLKIVFPHLSTILQPLLVCTRRRSSSRLHDRPLRSRGCERMMFGMISTHSQQHAGRPKHSDCWKGAKRGHVKLCSQGAFVFVGLLGKRGRVGVMGAIGVLVVSWE